MMRFRPTSLVAPLGLVIVVFASAGCSSSSNTDSSSGFVSDYCAALASCCGRVGRPTDGAQCRALFGALAPTGSYDASKGKACLDQVHAAQSRPDFCDAVLGTGSASLSLPACDGVYSSGGTVAPGGPCTKSSECAPSSEGKVTCATAFVGSSEVRKCQVQIHGKVGDSPCIGTVDGNSTSFGGGATDVPPRGYLCYVADGLYCDGASGKCLQQSPVGGACASSFGKDCTNDGYCDSASKTCVARLATGSACTTTNACVTGDYCDSTSKSCAVKLAEGSACTGFDSCASGNCVNNKCAAAGSFGEALLCGGN